MFKRQTIQNIQDFSQVLEWSWPRLFFKAKAKNLPSEAEAKSSKWCPRESSRPRPGLDDNKTGESLLCLLRYPLILFLSKTLDCCPHSTGYIFQ